MGLTSKGCAEIYIDAETFSGCPLQLNDDADGYRCFQIVFLVIIPLMAKGIPDTPENRASGNCRWHAFSCTDPQVVAIGRGLDTKIRCISCGKAPPEKDIVPTQASSYSLASELADLPPGQLNLWWPECVPWARRAENGTSNPPESVERQRGLNNGQSKQQATPEVTDTSSTIYPVRLSRDEFRLACLSYATDEESPIHLTLETYTDDNSPEYEAVSYTWGGEDGDSRLRRRIFVGPYWDILPQTENCWHLLQFLRPSRGIRLVWVDAICINQRDMVERGDQVSKMEQIYKECKRTILYLGPDAAPLLGDRFSRRQGFDKISRDALEKMLSRRYFRRVWVVQELILSPQVLVRLGDTDYYVEPTTMKRLQESMTGWGWCNSPAPWLEHMTQQELHVEDPFYPLQLCSNSQCSDPRDRLFGILSLISKTESGVSLRADYSVSHQHMWIGFLGHCLINTSTTWFLHRAGGLSALRNMPSWVPDLGSAKDWHLFKPPSLLEKPKHAYDMAGDKSIGLFSGEHQMAPIEKYEIARKLKYLFDPYDITELVAPTEFSSATICPDTGALLGVHLQKLFTIQSSPRRLVDFFPPYEVGNDTYQVFEFEQGGISLFLASNQPLDELISPRQDHVFLINSTTNPTPLILREIAFAGNDEPHGDNSQFVTKNPMHIPGSTRFRMITASPFMFLGGAHPRRGLRAGDYYSAKAPSPASANNREYPFSPWPFKSRTLGSLVIECGEYLDMDMYGMCSGIACHGICIFFGRAWHRSRPRRKWEAWDFLPLFWTLVQDIFRERDLEESYESLFDPKYSPHTDGSYIHITVEPEHWFNVEWKALALGDSHAAVLRNWEYRTYDRDWERMQDGLPRNRDAAGSPATVQFRTDINAMIATWREKPSIPVGALVALRNASELSANSTFEEIVDKLENPKEEWHSAILRGLLGSSGADGRVYKVDIY